jgi:malonate transporter
LPEQNNFKGQKICYANPMLQSLGVIFPVIAVILIGYGAARRGFFSADNVDTLNKFVFAIAAPALLFRNVAITEFPAVTPWGLWGSYYGAMLATMAISMAVARLTLPKQSASERVIFGFGASFSNTVMLGIPIILTAFGPTAGLPLFLVLAFHGLLIFTVALIGLEWTTNTDLSVRGFFPKLARAMSGQQIILGLLGGVIWNFTGLGLAPPIDRFLDLLGSAAIPVALVAVGGKLAHIAWRDSLGSALFISGFKLGLHPLLVFCAAHYIFALEPVFTATITLLAAMPTGVFTAVFATQYKTAQADASSTIVVSTLLGAVTIALWLTGFTELLVD